MKKFISLILSLAFMLSLSACSGEAATEDKTTLAGEINGEITISAYDTMTYKTFLEDAAKLFEEKYPGTTVKIETFSAMPDMKTSVQEGEGMMIVEYRDDPQGRQDYINRINTALMSGEGADILAMDVLPFYKYADSGQLENLAAYIQADPDFNKTDYRANIFDAVEYKSGTWFLPVDYSFTYYAYDSSLLTGDAITGFGTDGRFSAEELIMVAESSVDGNAKLFNKPDYARGPGGCVWDLLLEENYTSFVDVESKKANFDDGSFAALLESVKQYSELGYISKGATGQEDAAIMRQRAGEDATDRFFFKPKNDFSLISLFVRDLDIKMSAVGEGNTMVFGDDDEVAGIAAGGDGSVPFIYNQAYGINSRSQNKETAWAFLHFLLSEEMQNNTRLSQPVLNSAREQKAEIIMTSLMRTQYEQESDPALLSAMAQYNEAIEKLSNKIDTYIIRDTVVDDMISAEVRHFFEGKKTAAEVAAVLQNKVNLYLNE